MADSPTTPNRLPGCRNLSSSSYRTEPPLHHVSTVSFSLAKATHWFPEQAKPTLLPGYLNMKSFPTS
ncbi:hypothetical protein BS50DRAFT_571262 [Corynespora cassiicola Philippines]|uniref:Uncharacterized protein n=1 Tax=Corynespora cassiicola Philippines TaxID=1448308 RepID=A0A2T2NXX7_CORCC|nr:hypothetical protein BS50DRAFT_571262 [Corynespora cassiicola Philippines]